MTSNAEIIQTKMKTCVIQIAKEILGVRGSFVVKKNTMWWNEQVKVVIKEKKKCYLVFGKCKNEENLVMHKKIKIKTKVTTHEAN